MKSERRHELQQNELARSLGSVPYFIQTYGSYVLLLIVAVACFFTISRWRASKAEAHVSQTAGAMAQARSAIEELQFLPLGQTPPTEIARRRDELAGVASSALDTATNESTDSETPIRSAAAVARGDLYWTIANYPDLPGATTRPELQLRQARSDYLLSAKKAYDSAVAMSGVDADTSAAARFGLAAIAENELLWAEAQTQYEEIAKSAAGDAIKNLAAEKLRVLPTLKRVLYTGVVTTQPTTAPTSAPASGPATTSTSAPASAPATQQK